MDLSIPAAATGVEIVEPACVARLSGKIRIHWVLSFSRADWNVGTVAHLLTTAALGVKTTMVNAQGATSTSVTLDTVDTFSEVLCIEYLKVTVF